MHIHELLALITEARTQNSTLTSMLFTMISRNEPRMSAVQRINLHKAALATLDELSRALRFE